MNFHDLRFFHQLVGGTAGALPDIATSNSVKEHSRAHSGLYWLTPKAVGSWCALCTNSMSLSHSLNNPKIRDLAPGPAVGPTVLASWERPTVSGSLGKTKATTVNVTSTAQQKNAVLGRWLPLMGRTPANIDSRCSPR